MIPIEQSAANFEKFKGVKEFSSLNGMRCLSITYVIWHHTMLMPTESVIPMLTRGFLGVDIFFVISGFLIVTLLLREKEKKGCIRLKIFMRVELYAYFLFTTPSCFLLPLS